MPVDDPWKAPETRPMESPPKTPKSPWLPLGFLILGMSYLAIVGQWQVLLLMICLPLGFLLGWMYLVLPLRSFRTYWTSSNPDVQAIDPERADLPPGLAEAYRKTAEALAQLGFSEHGLFCFERLNSAAHCYLGLFEHPTERTLARWLVVVTKLKTMPPMLMFTSRFADGSEFSTTNNPSPTPQPVPKFRRGMAFPRVQTPAKLLAVHNRRMAENGEFSSRVAFSTDDPVGFLKNAIAREHDELVKAGYYRFDPSSQLHRLTFRAAYSMTWKLIWPWGMIRKIRRRRLADRWLRKRNLREV